MKQIYLNNFQWYRRLKIRRILEAAYNRPFTQDDIEDYYYGELTGEQALTEEYQKQAERLNELQQQDK